MTRGSDVAGPSATGGPRLGIVIPTLNEEEHLADLLDDLAGLSHPPMIVVADGGSSDGTLDIARTRAARTLRTAPGRALQMNVGARALDTPWVLFLHADSRLPQGTRGALERWLDAPPQDIEAAHFAFRLDSDGLWWTLIERGQRARERLTGLAYGDQGLLVSRSRYEEIGGIPELPLMEDVELMKRLRRRGPVDRIEAPIITSARRYREVGPFLGWLRNATLLALYSLGVPPRVLARWYRPRMRAGRRSAAESRA